MKITYLQQDEFVYLHTLELYSFFKYAGKLYLKMDDMVMFGDGNVCEKKFKCLNMEDNQPYKFAHNIKVIHIPTDRMELTVR